MNKFKIRQLLDVGHNLLYVVGSLVSAYEALVAKEIEYPKINKPSINTGEIF